MIKKITKYIKLGCKVVKKYAVYSALTLWGMSAEGPEMTNQPLCMEQIVVSS